MNCSKNRFYEMSLLLQEQIKKLNEDKDGYMIRLLEQTVCLLESTYKERKHTMKDVAGYNGEYKVTDDGIVYSFKKDKENGIILQQTVCRQSGFFKVALYKNGVGTVHYMHYLVAETFLGKRPEDSVVLMKSNNKYDVDVNNLYYAKIDDAS